MKSIIILAAVIVATLSVAVTGNASAFGSLINTNSSGINSNNLSGHFLMEYPANGPGRINPGMSMHKDSIDYAHFVGEVQNNGESPIRFAKIIATVYDANNSTVGTSYTYTDPTDISPKTSAPFDLSISPDNMRGADHFKLRLDYQ